MTDNPVQIPELPSKQAIDRLVSLLEPYRRITRPKFYGIGDIPDDGSLLVGNHTIYGLLDLPFIMAEVWKRRRIAIRGPGEHAHYAVPVWRDLLGVRDGPRHPRQRLRPDTRPADDPGLPRRRARGQQAPRPAVPAAVGGVHGLRPARDRARLPGRPVRGRRRRRHAGRDRRPDDPLYGQLAAAYEKIMGFPTPPIVRGVGLTGIPGPERLYFWFGDPVDTTRFAGQNDDTAARTVRDEVKQAVLAGIQFLRDERDKDPDRDLAKRLLHRPE